MQSDNLLKVRPNSIDYAKSFGIYLVILGHYAWAMHIPFHYCSAWSLASIITLFHMPFFFMVSGMLYKETDFKTTYYVV
jgi:fucose 4-O-acetylase-like acetyltransferase